MSPDQIRWLDYGRILLGRVPWTFAIEVVLRMAFIYLLLLVSLRLMGKRMASQMVRNELAALVALAGGVGPAVQDPKNGLVPAVAVAVVVVGVQRLVARLTKNHGAFEHLTQGDLSNLVERGTINMKALRSVALSRQRVIAHLRAAGMTNLGSVDRMYLEINGAFTIISAARPRPGLSLLPEWDSDLRSAQPTAGDAVVCSRCGQLLHDSGDRCSCGESARERAVHS
jgi:uncharacterized membrane protein YcaP (DUF421 family)